MEERMNTKRTVKKLSSVIELINHDSVKLIGKPSIRIRYEYDGTEGSQQFILLTGDIPKDSADSIISWLEDNITPLDIIYGLESNDLDVQTFKDQKKAA
jgi:hypothetical protein